MTAVLAAYHPDHMPWYGAVITLGIIVFIGGGFVVMVGRTITEGIGRRMRAPKRHQR